MSWPRLTIQGLMIAVAVAAVDIALFRLASREGLEGVAVTAVPMLPLNIAIWLAIRSARPGRAFWVGYLVVGGLVLGSWVWMLVWPGHQVPSPDRSSGTRLEKSLPHACWDTVLIVPLDWLEALWRTAFGRVPRWLRYVVGYPYFVMLHIGPGVLGGLIGRWVVRRRAVRQAALD